MTEALHIHVPGEPVGWQRPDSRGKVRYDTPRNLAVKEQIGLLAKSALRGKEPFSGAVRVRLTAWMPIRKSWSKDRQRDAECGVLRCTSKPDLDNVIKLALDALNGVAWKDDAAVVEIIAGKAYSTNPQTVITVEGT